MVRDRVRRLVRDRSRKRNDLGLTDLMMGARLPSAVGEVPVVEAVENLAAADVRCGRWLGCAVIARPGGARHGHRQLGLCMILPGAVRPPAAL
ncbi:hypothetical protein E2C11_07280 [Streptomyces lavendulae]|nr:hypothetical protein E2C11_07280 [Streptomyces lavendulae]